MKSIRSTSSSGLIKVATGIRGFDDIASGGVPHARTTLLVGGPGSGKTIFALHFLVHGAQSGKEAGIFVGFEENTKDIMINAEGFGWNLAALRRNKLFFLDALPTPDLIQSGDFDLNGMLAGLEAQIKKMGAQRIVFDALDIVLSLLPDPMAVRREIYRLHAWLAAHRLTGIITLRANGDETSSINQQPFGFMQFMVDCVILLKHEVEHGVSERSLRVQKFRGAGFDEDASPFLITKSGIEVVVAHTPELKHSKATDERISCGVPRLDTMLGGGYHRGASILITGSPGAAKTTLSAAFAQAACERGEPTLFISFDSDANEVVRNLASVGIRLERHVKSGCLRMVSARRITGSAETYLSRVKKFAQEHQARCLVIDPVSTWFTSTNEMSVQRVAERLIDWSKSQGSTLVCTRLLTERPNPAEDGLPMEMSTIVDTWIHLTYPELGGERNRGLSIIKSRGTAHSNQVRELILSDSGVTLADAYIAGGEVLMGTMRWQKESSERVATENSDITAKITADKLDADQLKIELQMKSLQAELVAKQVEKALLLRAIKHRDVELTRGRSKLKELRGTDAEKPVRN